MQLVKGMSLELGANDSWFIAFSGVGLTLGLARG